MTYANGQKLNVHHGDERNCKSCEKDPVISRRYSGENLCRNCFFRSFEKNAEKELRNQINKLVSNSKSFPFFET